MKLLISHWLLLQRLLNSRQGVPKWVSGILSFEVAKLLNLPMLDESSEGQIARPEMEQITVTKEYLDFLREQIKLGARGAAWSEVLMSRLSALRKFQDRQLLTVVFYRKPNSFTVRIDPESEAIIHTEEC